ncbi:hypothetical protein [Mesorhizobium sp. BR1-1-2]|uniref:hypothetical protein n=1 Tax=Mesorhizobium sp. BR1-1-2 TaxID=2876652 RepID=UPI001CCAD688|nr:hypothetical protein [Mesorhizobium sp. BR1-1-2]MBZ9964478.1 hypothetical protein [Mesorhizobium sp. BR1-1-2]
MKALHETRQDTAEAFKPAAQGFLVVALSAKRVGAANPMMEMRRECFRRRIPAMIVDVIEALSDRFLDEIAI